MLKFKAICVQELSFKGLYCLLGRSVLKNKVLTAFLDCTRLQLTVSLCVHFNFPQLYKSKPSKNSTFAPLILSVREAFYCNYICPVECKEMGIVTT